MKTRTRLPVSWTTAALLIGIATVAPAATPAQTCQRNKNKDAGNYAYCRQKAEAKFALTGDASVRTAALQTCVKKYSPAWTELEAKASAAGATCPSMGDVSAIQAVVDEHTTNIATALAGGPLSVCAADLSTCHGDLGSCQSAQVNCDGDLGTCQGALASCQGGRNSMTTAVAAPSSAGASGSAGVSPAAKITPALKCEQGKNLEAGKYGLCRQNAEAKFAITGDAAARTVALQKCVNTYSSKWAALEHAAVKAGGACPSMGDQGVSQSPYGRQLPTIRSHSRHDVNLGGHAGLRRVEQSLI